MLNEYGFWTLNAASGCALKRISSHFVLTHKSWSSKPLHNVTEEDVKERLAVIWRGVTDDWPTHSSMFTSVLLWQIGPIYSPLNPLAFYSQLSSRVLVVWIIQTWWDFKIQSTLFGSEIVVCDARLCVLFHCRSVVIRVVQMVLLWLFQLTDTTVMILNAALQFPLIWTYKIIRIHHPANKKDTYQCPAPLTKGDKNAVAKDRSAKWQKRN